jgi:hypothetical protein
VHYWCSNEYEQRYQYDIEDRGQEQNNIRFKRVSDSNPRGLSRDYMFPRDQYVSMSKYSLIGVYGRTAL